jgi:hypothetical protein
MVRAKTFKDNLFPQPFTALAFRLSRQILSNLFMADTASAKSSGNGPIGPFFVCAARAHAGLHRCLCSTRTSPAPSVFGSAIFDANAAL